MKYVLLATALALIVLGCSMQDDSGIVSELTRMEREFAAAALSGDVNAIEHLLADDFIGIGLDGRRRGKSEVLADMKSAGRSILALSHEDIRIAVPGASAVAPARTFVKWSHEEEELEGRFPYLRVWIRRHGRWLAVATQSGGQAH